MILHDRSTEKQWIVGVGLGKYRWLRIGKELKCPVDYENGVLPKFWLMIKIKMNFFAFV